MKAATINQNKANLKENCPYNSRQLNDKFRRDTAIGLDSIYRNDQFSFLQKQVTKSTENKSEEMKTGSEEMKAKTVVPVKLLKGELITRQEMAM